MKFSSNPLVYLFILAQCLIIGIFIVPLFMFYQNISSQTVLTLGFGVLTAGGVIYLWKMLKIERVFGRNLVKLGTAFWGLGWALMVMFEPQVGWWIFMGGWLVLTVGLFANGTADFHRRNSMGWAYLPLMAGVVPPLLELLEPYYFITHFEPIVQMQIMFLYASGWVLQGVTLTHSEMPQLSLVTEEALGQR
ncbi:MAG: hypothetical protein AAF490_23675 [Chloroflexota bacterium]